MSTAPSHLGRYSVEGEIGRGAMGIVYAARDDALDRPVAIKVLPDDFARDPERMTRFRREARLLAALSHPNIAAVYNLEHAADGPLILVMELIEGQNLGDAVRDHRMPVDELLSVGAQVCSALEAAHGRGIIHRDLKPQNIRRTMAGVVKVLDFGLAQRMEACMPDDAPLPGPAPDGATIQMPTQTGVITGTPGYMSPEQARGLPQDVRTDIFALGCTLFSCATGKPPFLGDTVMACLAATISEEPDWSRLPDDVPEGVREFLRRCMEKDTERRLVSASEARAMIESLRARRTRADVAPAIPGNLPRQLTHFVGRLREIDDLKELITSESLITLTGVGGCGKTRLALKVASETTTTFPDGTWYVELAPLKHGDRVPSAVARTIGVREEPGRALTETIVEHLRAANALLILDNCEHLLRACGDLATELLQNCAHLKIVATSREALGVAGEAIWQVPSLSIPQTAERVSAVDALDFEAVQLFAERAKTAQRGFALDDAMAPLVAGICRRLDGIPLAIELAASRARVLSLDQIHAKLDDRFRLLAGGGRTALERHRTLRATMEWSYKLLSPEEQEVLQQISVFAGSWTLDATVAVCGNGMDEFEALDVLTHLVDKSLVQVDDAVMDERRYRLLETVREFAHDELNRGDTTSHVHDRHLAHYRGLAEEAEGKLRGPEQVRWIERLQLDHENLIAALRWCGSIENGGTIGLQLSSALWWFWMVRGHFALGRRLLHDALHREGAQESTAERAAALNGACALAGIQGDYAAAQEFAEESLAIARRLDDRFGMARCLNNLGLIATRLGDYERARACHEESLALRREFDDAAGVATSLNNLGVLAMDRGDLDDARKRFEESLKIQRELGNQHDAAVLLSNLGLVAHRHGAPETARSFYEESLQLHRELGNDHGVAEVLNALGTAALAAGNHVRAGEHFAESLEIHESQGNRKGIAEELNNLGSVALERYDFPRARELFEKSLGLLRELGSPRGIATSLSNLGLLAMDEGNLTAARAPYLESLSIRSDLQDERGLTRLFEDLSQLASASGSAELAAFLQGRADARRTELGLQLSVIETPRHDRALQATRTALGEEQYKRHHQIGVSIPCGDAVSRVRTWLEGDA